MSDEPGQNGALASAVAHINASARRPIGPEALLAALSDERTGAHAHHVRAFLDEADPETLSEIVRSGALTYAGLAAAAKRHLPRGHETRTWLDERRA